MIVIWLFIFKNIIYELDCILLKQSHMIDYGLIIAFRYR
jgi:hypothetical protein